MPATAPVRPCDHWTLLRRPWPPAAAGRALATNARLHSPARLVVRRGRFLAAAELPPLPDDPAAAARLADMAARELDDLGADAPEPAEPPLATLEPAEPTVADTLLAAAREAGWPGDSRATAHAAIPLANPRRPAAAAPVLLDGRPALAVEVLPAAEIAAGCEPAVHLFSLQLAGALRLARPCHAAGGGGSVLAWVVPLADAGPAFLGHALGALAAFVAHGLAESRALATLPDLASQWLACNAHWAH